MTQTPASGPLAPVTTPPILSLPTATVLAGACPACRLANETATNAATATAANGANKPLLLMRPPWKDDASCASWPQGGESSRTPELKHEEKDTVTPPAGLVN